MKDKTIEKIKESVQKEIAEKQKEGKNPHGNIGRK